MPEKRQVAEKLPLYTPWFSSETLALYKSLTYLHTALNKRWFYSIQTHRQPAYTIQFTIYVIVYSTINTPLILHCIIQLLCCNTK